MKINKLTVVLVTCILCSMCALATQTTELEKSLEQTIYTALRNQSPYDKNKAPNVQFAELSFELDNVQHKKNSSLWINYYKPIRTEKYTDLPGGRGQADKYSYNFKVKHYTNLSQNQKNSSLADLFLIPEDAPEYLWIETKYASTDKNNALFAQIVISTEYDAMGPSEFRVSRIVRTNQFITVYEFSFVRDCGPVCVGMAGDAVRWMNHNIPTQMKAWVDTMSTLTLPKLVKEYTYVNNL